MPNETGHSYDVFVSYAHADNEKPEGAKANYGWVTTLAHNLNTGPGHYHKNLFTDHRLKPGDAFSDDLLMKVKGSTLLLLLLSQNYIDSEWCGKELDHFVHTHANDLDKPADVFVVELSPFETFKTFRRVPANIENLRKRLIHAKFWHQPLNVSAPLLAGYPSPQESVLEGERWYWQSLQELRNAIDFRLRALRCDLPSPVVVRPPSASPVCSQQSATHLGTVLLADTTDDLVRLRSAVKAALEPEGIMVLPEGDYLGLTPEEFKTEFALDLARCDLFVQMLSTTVGRTGKGFTAPLPQLQFDGAVAAKLPILQWCERLPGPGDIVDPRHAGLFNTAYLRATNRTAFEREILEQLRAIKQAAERARAAKAEPIPAAAQKLIFIDDIAGEPDLNRRLHAILQSANYGIRSLPKVMGKSEGKNEIDIAQVLKPCRAGITVFADRAKRNTVYNQLIRFFNQIAASRLPVARWGICVTPDTAECDIGIPSDNLVSINEQQVANFLRGLDT